MSYDELGIEIPLSRPDYVVMSPYLASSYEVNDRSLVVHDAVWDTETIGDEPHDEVFLQLVGHPVVTRLLNVELLSLGEEHSTMPNATGLTRWESQWGSVVLARKLSQEAGYDPRTRAVQQLRTFVSDLGHTAFSHMGDWLFQGFGGPENQHDEELKDFLTKTGVATLLQEHGFTLDEVAFPEKQDWIENDLPDLCVDRVDYGAREIIRWLDKGFGYYSGAKLGYYKIVDDQIVMTDQENALNFAIHFAMLPTEHWAQPTHRLQLVLLQEAIKRIFVSDESLFVSWGSHSNMYHPRDYLYSVDRDFLGNLEKIDELNWLLSVIMKQIGYESRRIFTTVRNSDLDRWFAQVQGTGQLPPFPDPLTGIHWKSRIHPLMPSNITLAKVDTDPARPPFQKHDNGITFYLSPLKPRSVDPVYEEDGELVRLSAVNEQFGRLRQEQEAVMRQAYEATLLMNNDFRDRIWDGLVANREEWPAQLDKPRMDDEQLSALINRAADYAVPHRRNRVQWNR